MINKITLMSEIAFTLLTKEYPNRQSILSWIKGFFIRDNKEQMEVLFDPIETILKVY